MFQASTPLCFSVYADFKTQDGFAGPKRFRGFRETGPRPLTRYGEIKWRHALALCSNELQETTCFITRHGI